MLNVFGAITVDQPGLLLLLAVLAPLAALLVYAARRARRDLRALRRVASLPAAAPSPDAVLRFKRGADGALTWVAVACVILGAADLRWGTGAAAVVPPPGGREVVLLVDLSRSMAVADVAPSRLRQGLTAAGELVDALPDAPVAVVGFSDDSHLLLPFTDDRLALRQQLAALHDQAPALGGSQLAAALRYASFELPGRTGAARTVVLVSDGASSAGDPPAGGPRGGAGGGPPGPPPLAAQPPGRHVPPDRPKEPHRPTVRTARRAVRQAASTRRATEAPCGRSRNSAAAWLRTRGSRRRWPRRTHTWKRRGMGMRYARPRPGARAMPHWR